MFTSVKRNRLQIRRQLLPMAAGGEEPPGAQRRSWANILGSNLPTTWSKNVLEVTLEKEGKGPFIVSDDECAKFMSKIGISVNSGEIEAVQICPNGRGVVFLTLRQNVPTERYLLNDVI